MFTWCSKDRRWAAHGDGGRGAGRRRQDVRGPGSGGAGPETQKTFPKLYSWPKTVQISGGNVYLMQHYAGFFIFFQLICKFGFLPFAPRIAGGAVRVAGAGGPGAVNSGGNVGQCHDDFPQANIFSQEQNVISQHHYHLVKHCFSR